MIITKYCHTCKIEKSTEMFYKHKGTKDGLQTQCKQCIKQYRKENSLKIIEYQKNYQKKNIHRLIKVVYTEKMAEKKRIYRQENREKMTDYQCLYRKSH